MNYNYAKAFPGRPINRLLPGSNNAINDKRILQQTVKRKIRPEPYPSTSVNNGFKQTIIKTRLLENLFAPTTTVKRSRIRSPNAKDYKCIVFSYQFTNSSKNMIFLPSMLDEFVSEEYVCRECFQVYSVFSMKQRDLDPLPMFDPMALKPELDPRSLPHYCVHFRVFYPDIIYFNEYEPYLNNTAGGSIVDLAFLFGMFMTKMGDYHRKVTNFLNVKKPKTLDQLIDYIISINFAIKNEQQALSFLHCFHLFHSTNKQSPFLDDKDSFSLLLKEADEMAKELEQSENQIITFEQLIIEDFGNDSDAESEQFDHTLNSATNSKFKLVPYRSKSSTAKRKVVPTQDELTLLINRVIAGTEVKTRPIELTASFKDLRLLVLYYAPSRLEEFDHLTNEVLSRTPCYNIKK